MALQLKKAPEAAAHSVQQTLGNVQDNYKLLGDYIQVLPNAVAALGASRLPVKLAYAIRQKQSTPLCASKLTWCPRSATTEQGAGQPADAKAAGQQAGSGGRWQQVHDQLGAAGAALGRAADADVAGDCNGRRRFGGRA